jgi:hypothetical protein
MNSLGTEDSVDLFPRATWTSHPATRYAGAEYPGLRPTGSWRLDPDGELRGLNPDALGWRDRVTGRTSRRSGFLSQPAGCVRVNLDNSLCTCFYIVYDEHSKHQAAWSALSFGRHRKHHRYPHPNGRRGGDRDPKVGCSRPGF